MSETKKKQELERHTTWVLARLAGCGDPDRADHSGDDFRDGVLVSATAEGSPGARFLRSVEDAVYELWERLDDDERAGDVHDLDDDGRVHEIADSAPDVYTHARWQEFADLAAWQEDVSEHMTGPSVNDSQLADIMGWGQGETKAPTMEELAGVALYMIAERLAWALLEELAEGEEESDEDPIWIGYSTGQVVTIVDSDGDTFRGTVETYDADEIHVENLVADDYGNKRMMLFTRDEVASITAG